MRSLVRPVLVPVRAALPSLRRGRRSFWFNSDQSDYKRRLAQRINWDKPGERLKYVADDILYAMPPPGRPMPLSAAELRRQELRSKLPLLVLVLFAAGHIAYSRVNETRDSRVFLEERFPSLARALAFVGFLKRFPESESVDRATTVQRLFQRFQDRDGLGVSVREAVDIAWTIRGRREEDLAVVRALAGTVPSVGGAGAAARWDTAAFAQFASRALAEVPDTALYFACGYQLGVWPVGSATEEAFGALYDYLVSQNHGSPLFTVPFLAAITEEVGFGFEEEVAREFLTECRSVQLGEVAMRPADWLVVEPPSTLVMRRKKFGEQTAEELERIAEEVARAARERSGLDATPTTDWSAVRARGAESVERLLAARATKAADTKAAGAGGGDATTTAGPSGATAGPVGVAASSSGGAGAGVAVPAYFDLGAEDETEAEIRELRARSRLLVRSHVRVPVTRAEFVNYLAQRTAGMPADEVRKHLDVFYLINSLAPSAGVAPTTVSTARTKGVSGEVR